MKLLKKGLLALVGVLFLGVIAGRAQESAALLDALVKKGVLSDQEAEDIRANLAKDYAQTAGGKLVMSNSVQQLKLYGDGRLRFEYLDVQPQRGGTAAGSVAPAATTLTDRFRYRLRVGADYTLTDNFSAGFELESSTANDSANQTFGDEFGKFNINIGLVYLKYKATDWATLTAGKMRNPLYTTDLVWDPDINPEGGAEQFLFNPTDSLSIGVTAAQFIYAANNEAVQNVYGSAGNGPTGGANIFAGGGSSSSDVWMFTEQIPVTYKFNDKVNVEVAPGFTIYTGGGNLNTEVTPLNGGPAVSGAGGAAVVAGNPNGGTGSYYDYRAANNLAIITAPGEVNFKIGDWDIPFKGYWDFAWNLEGKERVQQTYFGGNRAAATASGIPASLAFTSQNLGLGDNLAWLAGLQVGQLKKKGDWMAKADFRQTGLGAVDPNLNDSDFANSQLNQQGIKVSGAYNFTDFLTGSLTYYNTWNYKTNLFDQTQPTPVAGSEAANANTLAAANTTQRVQLDLLWKF